MPISEYTGREITEEQAEVENAWNEKFGKKCNIQCQYLTHKNNWFDYYDEEHPCFDWQWYRYRIKPEPEKENRLPWNTDIFNMPGFPKDCDNIQAISKNWFFGRSSKNEDIYYQFPLIHNCTDFENSILHRPGTEKILPCPLCGDEDIEEFIEKSENVYICNICGCKAPKSSWQKRKV